MPKYSESKAVARILDANLNRLREGLRVCEELARFVLNNKTLTARFKKMRHDLKGPVKALAAKNVLSGRNSEEDVGRHVHAGELKRKGLKDIFYANIQRSKESARVLEEFAKLKNKRLALIFKEIRYRLYEAEFRAFRLL